MSHVAIKSDTLAYSLRWVARLWSLITIGLLILFFVGEGFDPLMLSLREWALFLFFPLGLILGLLLAWRWEGWGGLLVVGTLVGFYLTHYLSDGRLPRGPYFALFAAPGLFFLWYWLITHEVTQRVETG